MPASVIRCGPWSAFYVGIGGGSEVLTQVTATRTSGSTFSYSIPEEFQEVAGNSVQTGRSTIELSMTFLDETDQVVKLANGLALAATNRDDSSTFAKYTLLCLSADPLQNSLYIPLCYSQKNLSLNMNKTGASIIPVNFTFSDRNRFNHLYYYRPQAALVTLLGARSPV